jgi:hypothetical protein
MRLLYQKEKYIKYSMRVAKKAQKHRLRNKNRDKSERIVTAKMSPKRRQEWSVKKHYKAVVKAPINLSFLDNPESVTEFIAKTEKILQDTPSLYFDMRQVEKIDYPTIAALLAVTYRSIKSGIKINGNFPDDDISKSILMKSGFLYTMFSKNPDAGHKHDINADNQLFTLDTADLEVAAEIIKYVSIALFSKEKKLPGLKLILGELMDNTRSWAAKLPGTPERWWLSINYNRSSKRVSFVFVDYGVGIFTSLSQKNEDHPVKRLLQKAQSAFGLDAAEKHLKSIVTESAGKVHKLHGGHGQGIYGIYQSLQRSEMEKLFIISNNAFGNIGTNDYKKLNKELNGTLYYWEICDKNI